MRRAVLGDDEVEARIRKAGLAGVRLDERERRCPVFACMRRAVSSWAGVMSTPTGRAPRFASQAEK